MLAQRRTVSSIPSTQFPHIFLHAHIPIRGSRGIDHAAKQTNAHVPSHRSTCLLVVLLSLVVNDVEELELVDTLGGGDDTEPVTELHLLEELLGANSKRSCQQEFIAVRL